MLNLVCFRHREYNGSEPPVLSCKTCCKIYIDSIRNEQKNTNQMIEEKRKKYKDKNRDVVGNSK